MVQQVTRHSIFWLQMARRSAKAVSILEAGTKSRKSPGGVRSQSFGHLRLYVALLAFRRGRARTAVCWSALSWFLIAGGGGPVCGFHSGQVKFDMPRGYGTSSKPRITGFREPEMHVGLVQTNSGPLLQGPASRFSPAVFRRLGRQLPGLYG